MTFLLLAKQKQRLNYAKTSLIVKNVIIYKKMLGIMDHLLEASLRVSSFQK